MEYSDVLMTGYVELYNPYKLNIQNVERKFPGYRWGSDDYSVQLNNVHFIDKGKYIDFNVNMINDPSNAIYFKRENNTDILNCTGLFSVNVPRKYLKKFIKKNKYVPDYQDGFDYDISIFDYYNNDNIVTNDCIEIYYPYKLIFTDLEVIG